MTRENLEKLHKHLSFLASGKFTELDFRQELGGEGEDIGRHLTGRMTPERKQLIIGDAKRHLENLIRKHPYLIPKVEEPIKEESKEEPELVTEEVKEVKQTKSKGKK